MKEENMENNIRGVMYVAFGDNFRKEVLFSIESLKKHNPGLHVTVFSDKPLSSDLVDDNKLIQVQHLRPKIDYIDMTPYDETLFLDTDTIIDYNIEDMYELLDNFDFAITHDLARKRKKYSQVIPEYGEIPYSFSEVNTGVFVFKNNEYVKSLFKDWKHYFYKYFHHCPWDQPSFRISLWKACAEGLKLYIFPVEYNIRSKQNREKNRIFHDSFGPDHLTPRIYHMHADMRINQGTYEVESLKQALEFCKKNHMEY